eukprot:2543243-Prymnesium_polylepis.2
MQFTCESNPRRPASAPASSPPAAACGAAALPRGGHPRRAQIGRWSPGRGQRRALAAAGCGAIPGCASTHAMRVRWRNRRAALERRPQKVCSWAAALVGLGAVSPDLELYAATTSAASAFHWIVDGGPGHAGPQRECTVRAHVRRSELNSAAPHLRAGAVAGRASGPPSRAGPPRRRQRGPWRGCVPLPSRARGLATGRGGRSLLERLWLHLADLEDLVPVHTLLAPSLVHSAPDTHRAVEGGGGPADVLDRRVDHHLRHGLAPTFLPCRALVRLQTPERCGHGHASCEHHGDTEFSRHGPTASE